MDMVQNMTRIEPPLSFSESAIAELYKIKEREQVPAGHLLRVGVKGGGCSGMSYVLGFDAPDTHDQYFEIGGLTMIMDKRHMLYLVNMEVDFQDGLNARGFAFKNPNATETCGCGTSFSA
ncbi:MAG: iron-sulfur cluster assembly accessory protein [Bacteroidetes bacterium]|jgi:iron-sulfur cluster assembly protein|nr:iron-sulfur cluster assembly accessory protein [Bacteroidota bacterium]